MTGFEICSCEAISSVCRVGCSKVWAVLACGTCDASQRHDVWLVRASRTRNVYFPVFFQWAFGAFRALKVAT